ncbi:MAG TPA: hypothetical protein VJS13_08260 [Pyrinomonadaceae bacterium]|nr:hypothetical protein [Pyrinomonadaceae bacterium]
MNPQTYLTVLTFLGLVIGTASGLFSHLTKTSEDIAGTTRKKLTTAGKWAFGIALLGFAGSFTSEMLKSSIQAKAHTQSEIDKTLKAQNEKENKNWQTRSENLQDGIKADTASALQLSEKNINETIEGFKKEETAIIESREQLLRDNLLREVSLYGKLSAAGTPLTSLTITFTVEDVPEEVRSRLRKEISDAPNVTNEEWVEDLFEHHNIDDDDAREFVQKRVYEQAIQPFIDFLATGNMGREHALLVVSLDRRYSALACLGWVDESDNQWTEVQSESDKEGKSLLPSGIFVGDEIDSQNYSGPGGAASTRKRHRRPSFDIEVKGTSVLLTLDLTLQSLSDALLRYPADSPATASLSDHIEFFTWSPTPEGEMSEDEEGSLKLPFDTNRVRHALTDVDLSKDYRPLPDWRDGDTNEWAKGNASWVRNAPRWMHRISVRIVPNGVEQVGKTYRLRLSSSGFPIEGTREDEPRGYVQIWHGSVLE